VKHRLATNNYADIMASEPTPLILEEIKVALRNNDGVLGAIFRLIEQDITTPSEVVAQGGISNIGHASNVISHIRSITEGSIPKSPSRAEAAGRTIGGLLRTNANFSPDTRLYLQDLRIELDTYATNVSARQAENEQFERASEALEENIEQNGGVYVYSFPAYIKSPAKLDPERFWFKIGMTERVVSMRIADQTRSTAMPEDPWILRVYRSETASNADLERTFHRMLEAAGHSRTQAKHGGREWYATNLDFLDQIAETLGLQVEGQDFID